MRKRSDFGTLPNPSPSRIGAAVVPAPETTAAPKVEEIARTASASVTAAAEKAEDIAPLNALLKPMPPAVEGSRFELPPDEAAATRRRSHRNKKEKRCVLSFCLFLGAFVGNFIAILLGRSDGTAAIGGLLALLVIPALIWSLVLAGLGLRECARYPGRYLQSKLFAILTLVFGGLFALCLLPGLIQGAHAVAAGARARREFASSREPIEVADLNFTFHPPASPWHRVEPNAFIKKGPALAFSRPDPMFFTVGANYFGLMIPDLRTRMVESTKADVRKLFDSYQFLNEQESTYNGLSGWQMEIQATGKGRDFYFVHWMFATNGVGYQLTIWGSSNLKSEIREQAASLFPGFELTSHQK
jgi:hypothetical protein